MSKPRSLLVETPFDVVAEIYDDTFTNSLIGRAQREAVWEEVDRVFKPGQRILEINCGTGVDAIHLGSRGVQVLACDVSPRMIDIARRRLSKVNAPVKLRTLANEQILKLREADQFVQFDGAFSNFAGLNCVSDLPAVARSLARLLKPHAQAVLCFFGPLCVWEILWYLAHGKPRKAFRRLKANGGNARLSGDTSVYVRYYSIRTLARIFSPEFRLKRWKGVGVAVPPSYAEPLAQRFPGVLHKLVTIDRWMSVLPLARGLADHFLLTLERVEDRSTATVCDR